MLRRSHFGFVGSVLWLCAFCRCFAMLSLLVPLFNGVFYLLDCFVLYIIPGA